MLNVFNNSDLKLNVEIYNSDVPSDDTFYYNQLLVKATGDVINPPFDSELFEFKPNSNTINYFIYFLDFKDMKFNQDVINNIEPAFSSYLSTAYGILTGNTNNLSPFDFKQNNDHALPETHLNSFKDAKSVVQDKPYVVTNYVGEYIKLKPIKAGLPLFYNTFTFPFSTQIDTWKDYVNKFADKSYLFNSFLLLDFYSSTDPLTQQKIMSIPIFVVDRYMMFEQSVNGVKQLRPVFSLKETVEGYSLFFLKNFGINKLYVRYSFWDSLNGVRIPLIPSSINTKYKKGIQSVTNFNHKNEYLMFDLDFTKKKYDTYEYNKVSGDYDIKAFDFDLYQLFYDDYWAGKVVPNTRPIALQEPSSYLLTFNETLDLSINRTIINKEDTINAQYIDQTTIDNYFNIRYQNTIGNLAKNYLKQYTNNLLSMSKTFGFNETTLYTTNNTNIDIKTNCFQKQIDTITITNNNNDNAILYDIFIGDLNITHDPLYANNVGFMYQMVYSNYDVVDNIYIKYKSKPNSPQRIFVENYATYSPIGLNNNNHSVISEFYNNIPKALQSPYNKDVANSYGIIESIDFDTTNPDSLGSYIVNNYVNNYGNEDKGQHLYCYSNCGKGSGHYADTFSNNISSFYSVLGSYSDNYKYAGADPNLYDLKFWNSTIERQNKLIKPYMPYDSVRIKEYLCKDIDMDQNIVNTKGMSDINPIITALNNKDNAVKNMNTNNFFINLRDCMCGLNLDCQRDNLIIKQNETIGINLNFFMGETFGTYIYNAIPGILMITANINIILSDKYGNRKKYTIPVSYKISIKF